MGVHHVPQGYRFAGGHVGIKAETGRPDLALFVSDRPASAAGVFTRNRVKAAPVRWCASHLPSDAIRALVVNSGNANACTGAQGEADAARMATVLGEAVGCSADESLVCSTGVIGRLLPMPVIEAGTRSLAGQLGRDPSAVTAAAEGILTTDTCVKIESRQFTPPGSDAALTVLGVAKGAAMIGPDFGLPHATMLAFVVTDAPLSAAGLQPILEDAVTTSFQCIRVDGHTSTNDTVLLLANGAVGGLELEGAAREAFAAAVTDVCQSLAQAIVRDAEGASHLIVLDVVGTRDDEEARKIGRAVVDSPLVKTAVHGNDPNWGRICSAAGYAGVDFEEQQMSLRVNGTLLYDAGTPTAFDEATESRRMKESHDVAIELSFTRGPGRCRYWASDLTAEYVRLNADYTT